jgi:hypothetical protein
MIMEAAGEALIENGTRRATVAAGPIPGRTPINVPKNTPMKQNRRLMGIKATEKPIMTRSHINLFRFLLYFQDNESKHFIKIFKSITPPNSLPSPRGRVRVGGNSLELMFSVCHPKA